MQSGTTGINTVRMYNPIKQGIDQDPNATFIRKWVPELGHLSTAEIHKVGTENFNVINDHMRFFSEIFLRCFM